MYGNQKATSEYGVSFKQNHLQSFYYEIFFQLDIAIDLLSQFTKIISTFLDYNEYCNNERPGNTQKELLKVKQAQTKKN